MLRLTRNPWRIPFPYINSLDTNFGIFGTEDVPLALKLCEEIGAFWANIDPFWIDFHQNPLENF